MLKSKAIKDPEDYKPPSKLWFWWVETPVADWYYDFVHKYIKNPIFQVKRLYQWYMNVFRYDYDFDGHCLFAIIEYKLKRLEKCLINGHAVQEPKDMKAIKLAIKLSGRLKDDKYEEISWNRIERKWGELKTWTTPCENKKGYSQWHSKYERVNTKEDEDLCRLDRLYQWDKAFTKMKRDEKNLYSILHKYLRNLWD